MVTRKVEPRPIGMVEVGFFLSRYGEKKSGSTRMAPPAELDVSTWKDAYAAFYSRLGGNRTSSAFKNSLKNQRDTFDAFIEESSRQGWKQAGADRPIEQLTHRNKRVFDQLSKLTRAEAWARVSKYVSYLSSITEAVVKNFNTTPDAVVVDIIEMGKEDFAKAGKLLIDS